MPDREDNAFRYSLSPTEEAGSCQQSASDLKQMGLACDDSTIDWQAAAPSWGAILVGVLLPIVVAFVLVCWLISRAY